MEIKVRYVEEVFKPLEDITDIPEGEELEIHFEREDWNTLAMSNPSFDFLRDEPDIYTEDDVIEYL